MLVDFDERGQHRMDFVTEEWVIMDSEFDERYKVEMSGWICFLETHSFSLHKTLTDGLELCGSLADYCDVFISCLDSHSDGTHWMQRIYWGASEIILNVSKSVQIKEQITSWMAWMWEKLQF